ncbi:MAG: hypothetical protein J7L61_00065, partial [Thermoplasmata archaeon]|nr:hypothetical protein [Thermoplasmata archaeon]
MVGERVKDDDNASGVPSTAPQKDILTAPQWRQSVSRFSKRFAAGWRIYRHSKMGMVGLSIIAAFVLMALLAPFLTPYSPQFLAPAEDVFDADRLVKEIPRDLLVGIDDPGSENWMTPVGYSTGGGDSLDTIVTASREGHVVVFDVE